MSLRVAPALAASLLTLAPILASAQPIPFERSLKVGAGSTLDVGTGSGDVAVRAGDGATIVVKGTVSVRNGSHVPANAGEIARQLAANPPIEQTGDAVKVGRLTDETINRAVSISYEIAVPAATRVVAGTGSGDVSVTGVQTARVSTGSGDVRVAGIAGQVEVRTGSGDIALQDAMNAATLETGSGDVVAALSGSGDIRASTASGDLTLTGVVGRLSASTASGGIDVTGKPTGDWQVSSASGDMHVTVAAEQGYTLDASTTSGDIAVAAGLSVEKQPGRRHAQGAVRGGGPTLRLSTASGDIAVK
jgi:DUF4097 and DUF4098 domain-containing protein YvlB